MANKAVITREEILEQAYIRAMTEGLAALGVREVARACGVATGTIYNYFPDKASLVTEVVVRFWEDAVRSSRPAEGGPGVDQMNTLEACRYAKVRLGASLEHFRANWLREISMLDARTLERTREAERKYFCEIVERLTRIIEADTDLCAEARKNLNAAALAEFIWRTMIDSMRSGDSSCETLFYLLDLALYKSSAHPSQEGQSSVV